MKSTLRAIRSGNYSPSERRRNSRGEKVLHRNFAKTKRPSCPNAASVGECLPLVSESNPRTEIHGQHKITLRNEIGCECSVGLRLVSTNTISTVPPDSYEHVGELAADITNATPADDHGLAESLYQRLHVYHEEQLAAGCSHPFLVETLADYTDDPGPPCSRPSRQAR
ncbi:MAG: hypothetical protein MUF81_11885 [Verrucomicrobia bacterium]|jgi:hypothetical protein|nr:hypothetical protein [Verrucomicrobiota bacterium]